MEASNANLFKDCVLRNEMITVPGVNTEQKIKEIGDELRRDLLSLKIPHWKVVGIRVTKNGVEMLDNYITKVRGISRSYAELLASTRLMIYAEGGGFPAKFQKVKDKYKDTLNFKEASFMACNEYDVTTSSNIFYETEASNAPKSLISGQEIIKFSERGCLIEFLLHRGTESYTFEDSIAKLRQINLLVGDDVKEPLFFAPIAQDYDLTNLFTVKEYEKGDTGIFLRFKKDLNEDVLQKILRDYAVGLCD